MSTSRPALPRPAAGRGTGVSRGAVWLMRPASARAMGAPWEQPESALRPDGKLTARRAPRAAAPGGLRRRQAHDERRPAVGRVARLHPAVMGVDDPGDDRQAEPGAAAALLAAALRAPEALEQLVRVVGRQARAVVADLDAHLTVGAHGAQLDRRARRRVDERVAHEVRQDLAQLVGVAEHGRLAVDRARDLTV